jgi:hypothetical protein
VRVAASRRDELTRLNRNSKLNRSKPRASAFAIVRKKQAKPLKPAYPCVAEPRQYRYRYRYHHVEARPPRRTNVAAARATPGRPRWSSRPTFPTNPLLAGALGPSRGAPSASRIVACQRRARHGVRGRDVTERRAYEGASPERAHRDLITEYERPALTGGVFVLRAEPNPLARGRPSGQLTRSI